MADGATTQHRIVVCTKCRHVDSARRPGLALIERLNDAVAIAGLASTDEFVVEGTVCLTGCGRPCTIAFSASAKAIYLFGDIGSDADVEALVDFARLLRALPDGFTKSSPRPHGRMNKILARIPAAVIACESSSTPDREHRFDGGAR
jgi:predicted metal-binding protein